MIETYQLSPRRAWIARAVAVVLMLVAFISVAVAIGSVLRLGTALRCDAGGCAERVSLVELAPQEARPALSASEPAQAAFGRYVARASVRMGLAAARLVDVLPFAVLMVTVGIALQTLGARRGGDLGRALPWLRRGALAALVMVVATPVAGSLEAMILYPGTPMGPMWYLEVDFRGLLFDLLLASVAFAVVWALDAGSRAERDVADFV